MNLMLMVPSIWVHNTITGAWLAFVLYWLASAFRIKRAQSRESIFSRLSYAIPTAFGYYLIFAKQTPFAILEGRFIERILWIALAGTAATLVGIGFAIWARVTLGRNWSGSVTIKKEHELISIGPYAHFRHPIYSGLLLATLGTALVIGQWRGVLGWAIILVAFSYKAKIEERVLTRQFGSAFEEHRRRTGFLLPRFSQPSQSSRAAQA